MQYLNLDRDQVSSVTKAESCILGQTNFFLVFRACGRGCQKARQDGVLFLVFLALSFFFFFFFFEVDLPGWEIVTNQPSASNRKSFLNKHTDIGLCNGYADGAYYGSPKIETAYKVAIDRKKVRTRGLWEDARDAQLIFFLSL